MFQEFPKALYRGDSEVVVVHDAEAELERLSGGFRHDVASDSVKGIDRSSGMVDRESRNAVVEVAVSEVQEVAGGSDADSGNSDIRKSVASASGPLDSASQGSVKRIPRMKPETRDVP